MFSREQSDNSKPKISSKKKDFGIGMAFVKRRAVKRSFTYKEFSLIAGVLVALIIVFTLWFRNEALEQSSNAKRSKPAGLLHEAAKSFVKKTFAEIRF